MHQGKNSNQKPPPTIPNEKVLPPPAAVPRKKAKKKKKPRSKATTTPVSTTISSQSQAASCTVKKAGRPKIYTASIARRICELIATTTWGIHRICREEGMPSPRTVFGWLYLGSNEAEKNPHLATFLHNYSRAKDEQADLVAMQIIEIADDDKDDTTIVEGKNGSYPIENKEWTRRSQIRVDARKWIAAHLLPKRWGDKLDLTTGGQMMKTAVIVVPDKETKDELDKLQ